MFVPPEKWFHQHFNVGAGARALPGAPPAASSSTGYAEKVEDRARDQIEYVDEDPFIREKFEAELAQRGLKSAMPAEAYTNRDYEWAYTGQVGRRLVDCDDGAYAIVPRPVRLGQGEILRARDSLPHRCARSQACRYLNGATLPPRWSRASPRCLLWPCW